MAEIIAIVDEEINKVIQRAVELDREVCEADLICARINIIDRLKTIESDLVHPCPPSELIWSG